MGVLMKKILEAFAHKTIQEFARILKTFSKKGFTVDDFIEYAKKEKEEFAKDVFEMQKVEENGVKVKKMVATRKSTLEDRKPKENPEQKKFIVPGELELMTGVLCSKCGSDVYTTAVCCSNPLKLQGFLRKTICSSCGIENGQK